jgi:hypothetical protein
MGERHVREAPAWLWVYVLLVTVPRWIEIATGLSPGLGLGLLTITIGVVLWVLLLRGSRVIWSLLVAFQALVLLTAPFLAPSFWRIFVASVALWFLLDPDSWYFIWGEPAKASPTSPAPEAKA